MTHTHTCASGFLSSNFDQAFTEKISLQNFLNFHILETNSHFFKETEQIPLFPVFERVEFASFCDMNSSFKNNDTVPQLVNTENVLLFSCSSFLESGQETIY